MIGLMEAAGHYTVIGLVVPGEMEEIYGRLRRVKVLKLVSADHAPFYVIEWQSVRRGVLTTGQVTTRVRRRWVYDPHSLDWEDHVGAGIKDIFTYGDGPV